MTSPSERSRPLPSDLGSRFATFVEGLTRPVVFFDTETTGTDPSQDRIVELSLVRISPAPVGVEAPRTWRTNPGVRIPIEASEIHGIYNKDVDDAPSFGDIADEVLELIAGADLAGFNIHRFDIRVLQAELHRVHRSLDLKGVRVIDTQVIYHQREPRNLAAALNFYCDKELTGAHGAQADTVATVEVFAGQLARYGDLAVDMDDLHKLSSAINSGYVDTHRRFAWRDNEPVFNFGKLKGKSLRWAASDPSERAYLKWILQGNFEDDTKLVVREALEGQIRLRKPAAAS